MYVGEWNKKYSMNEEVFSVIDTPEKAYWLGFITADGSIDTNPSLKLAIGVHSKDKHHLETFRDFIEANVPIKESCSRTTPISTIRVCRKKIVNDLGKYGVVPNKSKKTIVPDIPSGLYSDFIRGCYDGDGSLTVRYPNKLTEKTICAKPQCRWLLYSGTLAFLESIQAILVKECGIAKTKILRTGQKQYTAFCLAYHGNKQVDKIFSFLLRNSRVKLDRKYPDIHFATA
jgi:hypothetical protein